MIAAAPFSDDLELAFEMARLAASVALPVFQRGTVAETKPDGSPVTEADLAVERHLLERLARDRPEDAVLSEESGARGSGPRRWIIDPIDGTHFFAKGSPTWGTHIALESTGELVLGIITRPVRGELWWALRGQGAYRCGLASGGPAERLHVSDIDDPSQARVMRWGRDEALLGPYLLERDRWIDTSLDGVLDLVSGRIDAMIDIDGRDWDVAPAVLITEEAGGLFVDRDGGHRLDRLGGWFTNGRLHAALGGPKQI